ncbi:MAG TPA: ComEC/Rec2 family competence protein [Chthoniobacterales bacterium]|nr:ComEC/Rec2 family competence protein [Chthoniobacterales bacterium]
MKPQVAWARQPFFGIALSAVLGVLVADRWPYDGGGLALLLAGVGGTAWLIRRSLLTYAVVGLGFYFLHSQRTIDSPGQDLARALGEEPRPITIEGLVISEPKMSERGSASFLLQAESIEIDGHARRSRAKFLARWRYAVEFGDTVRLFGTAEKVEGPRNPGEFDARAYLQRQDVHRALIVRYPENGALVGRGGGAHILRAAQKSRTWMQHALSRGLENSPDVTGAINGMVLGLRHQSPEDIEEPFQQTGTLHLFSVSGLHVGIMAQLLWLAAPVLRLRPKWATALIIPLLFFYAAVTGLHTSSVRAALMAAVLMGGFIVERPAFSFNGLAAAAVIILAWNSQELFSVGFQLSFCVVAAILLLNEPVFALLRRWIAPDPFLPRSLFTARQRAFQRFLTSLARATAVSFAASIGSLPLMIWYYHLVTLISLGANLVVVPIAFFVLASALVSLATAPVSIWLSVVFNNANWALTKLIFAAVHFFAQMPGGHFYVEHPRPPKSDLEINVLDLRGGAAIHVRAGKRDWLFDTGPARDYERTLRSYLRSRGIDRLDGLVLTHGDAGHVGGAIATMIDFRPRTLIDTAGEDRSLAHRKFNEWLSAEKRPRQLCHAGHEIRISPEITARILFPPANFRGNRADDQALVVQLFLFQRPRALLVSDSGAETEQALLRAYPELRCNVLIKGQHHSGVSGSDEFLRRVQPDAIVATSRDFPESERIKPDWAEALQARNIKLLRQDQTGAVQLRFTRDRWESTSYVTGEIFRSDSR